ncbi:MAG: exodeoxyribonuclease V subunit gamma, partial [Clostridia bacterium]|nr:exodeoxyribonuclease V subunit gamma [Clostridia bacterium]
LLKLIISRAGYGKTTYIQKRIKELVSENKEAVLIIPEQISFESERDVLKAVGPSNLQKVSVMSFTRLCSLFFASYGGREKPYIDAVGKTALMEQTLKKLLPSLTLFRKSALTPQFCELMIDLDSKCKKNSVCTEMLLNSSEKNAGILKEKLFETSLILSEYQNELNKDYFDPLDDLSVVTNRVSESDFFKGKTVFIDSFTGFTLQQLELIKKIIKLADDTFVSFGFDGVYSQREFSLFSNVSKIALDLKKYATENGIEVGKDKVLKENHRSKTEDLDFLEKNIFSGENNLFDETPENILVTKTKNIYEEAEYVAKKILSLIKNFDLRFREISVISRDANEYNGVIDEVFEKYNIPLFVDNRETVESFSLFKFVSYSLSAVINNFDFDSVMSVLKTGILSIDDEEASLFEMYCLVWRISGKEFLKEFNLPVDSFLVGDDEYYKNAKATIENVRKKLIKPLETLKKEKGKNAKSICFAIYNLIINCNCGANLKQKAEFLEEKGYIRLAENTARSYDILI